MDHYTIDPMKFAITYGKAYFKAGDCVDMITGDTIAGPYCAWPKKEPRYFIIEGGRRQGKTLAVKLAKHLREKYESRSD